MKELGTVRTLLDELAARGYHVAYLALMALATAAYVVCVALPMRLWRCLANRTWP